jgi:nitrite reductase/ring-hydroxylating ferredoxin subunit
MAVKHAICYVDELPEGKRRLVDVAGRSIGIFNVRNQFYAVRNRCPHKGAPLCKGIVQGLMTGDEPGEFEIIRDGEILRCPWHSWEFDLKTGGSIFNPHKMRVKNYDVSIEPVAQDRLVYEFADDPDDDDPGIEVFDVSVEHEAETARSMIYVHV